MRKTVKKFLISLVELPGDTSYERIDFFRQRLLVSLLLCLAIFGTIA